MAKATHQRLHSLACGVQQPLQLQLRRKVRHPAWPCCSASRPCSRKRRTQRCSSWNLGVNSQSLLPSGSRLSVAKGRVQLQPRGVREQGQLRSDACQLLHGHQFLRVRGMQNTASQCAA